MQASEDGSLAFLISKVRTQPQVYTAYSKTAPLRDRAQSAELEAAVLPLKVHQVPFLPACNCPLIHTSQLLHA